MAKTDYITLDDLNAIRLAIEEKVRFEAKCGRSVDSRIVDVSSPTAFQEVERLTGCAPKRLGPAPGDKYRHMYIDWAGVRFWHSVQVEEVG